MIIESGIPIPEKGGYDFGSMQVGDSRFFEDYASAERMSNAGYNYASRHKGFKIMRRKCEGGWRVWRVS